MSSSRTSTLPASPSFGELGVSAPLIAALDRAGVTEPFAVQAATLPDAIAGRDVLVRAQTGSGKTLAFGLAAITRLEGVPAVPMEPLALILVPTRELAMQVNDGLSPLVDAVGLRIRLVAGGMPYRKQVDAIRRGVHIVVATPGRLMDLVSQGAVDLSRVRITVLDEADQMADMGFLPQVREILDLTAPGGQRMLFSATLGGEVDVLIRSYLRAPARHELTPEHAPVDTMDHHVLLVHPLDRDEIAARIGARDGRTIFFARTQAGVDRLTDHLVAQGVAAGGLHGGKTQGVRTRTLNDFREGVTKVLVATDVAARGIHVDGITLVVQVDPPAGPKDYLHRAGRTARAGETGTVVTLANPRAQRAVTRLVSDAGVRPRVQRVRPADEALADLTGARTPAGVPWEPPAAPRTPRRPQASAGRGGRPPRTGRDGAARRPGRAPAGARRARRD